MVSRFSTKRVGYRGVVTDRQKGSTAARGGQPTGGGRDEGGVRARWSVCLGTLLGVSILDRV